MKTKINIATALLTVIVSASLLLSSCRKKEETPIVEDPEDTEQSTANDNNLAESFVADIETIGSELSESGSLDSYRGTGTEGVSGEKDLAGAPCATISGLGTKIITVDFGSTGCLCQDGRTRSGKLIYDFTASTPTSAVFYRNPGFSMSVSSVNYVVDGYQITIFNKNVINTTPSTIPSTSNPGTNLTWAVTASVSIVKPNSAGTVSWSCSRTKELMNTNDTNCYRGQNRHIMWKKAIVKFNGQASGVNVKAENYTSLASNLVKDFNCAPDPQRPNRHPFIGGTILYTPGSRPARLIDFGNGTSCDLNATITIKGKVFNIVLN